MTSDGVIFFGMLCAVTIVGIRKWSRAIRAFEKEGGQASEGISDGILAALGRAGYTVIKGKQQVPVTYEVDGRLVQQSWTIEGLVERGGKQFALMIEPKLGWRSEWKPMQSIFPELAGIVVVNPDSGQVMNIQVE